MPANIYLHGAMMKIFRRFAILSAACTFSAGAADAQMINFTTSGVFSGAGCSAIGGVALVSAWCDAAGGIRLTYNFGAPQVLNGQGNASFGSFVTNGLGPSTFANVLFALTVNQTLPTAGLFANSAGVTGTVSAIQGGVVWAPITQPQFFINQTSYRLSQDLLTGGVRIDPPGMNGVTSDPQTIRGFVTTVPEPSTYLLMASGLAALGMLSRRRRSV